MKRCALVSDLNPDRSRLESLLREVDLVVPLTAEGDFQLAELPVAATSAVELISYHQFCHLAEEAKRARNIFLAQACDGDVIDGVDWPSLFLGDDHLFLFRDILFANALGESLLNRNFGEIVWIQGNGPDDDKRGSVFLSVLSSFSGFRLEVDRAHTRRVTEKWATFQDRVVRMAKRGRRRLFADNTRLPPSSGAVAIFSSQQWQRFQTPLLELQKTFGDDFHLWNLGPISKELSAWTRVHGILSWSVPYPARVDRSISRRFSHYADQWAQDFRDRLSREFDCAALACDELSPYFEQFFRYTLPRTTQWGGMLRRHLQAANPKWIVGSSAYTYLTALPYKVASSLGITSVALAHSYVSGDHSPVPSTFLACRNRFERHSYRRSFPAEERVFYCHDASDRLSYQPDPTLDLTVGPRPLVSLLTGSPTLGTFLMPPLDTKEFAQTLRALAHPPDDLSDIDFAFKSHPRFDISKILEGRIEATNVQVISSEAPITALVEASWVNVVFNHYGSVAADAAAADKPLIFLDSAHYFYPDVETLAYAAGEVVESVRKFWELLRRLLHDSAFYSALTLRCKEFTSRNLTLPRLTVASALPQMPTGVSNLH